MMVILAPAPADVIDPGQNFKAWHQNIKAKKI
jgi:hypothetical protein